MYFEGFTKEEPPDPFLDGCFKIIVLCGVALLLRNELAFIWSTITNG